jgi:environmental stress-induced protein Ves
MERTDQVHSMPEPDSTVRFDRHSLPRVPWKNGGGLTSEIACWPPGADANSFAWRASIATIAADGPFSSYPGVDRVIVLLEGGGVRLNARDETVRHTLATPHVPFSFAGEAQIDALCLDGESVDFNLMTRRGILQADVQVHREACVVGDACAGMLYAAAGSWRIDPPAGTSEESLGSGQGVWWSGTQRQWRLAPISTASVLIAVSWTSPGN